MTKEIPKTLSALPLSDGLGSKKSIVKYHRRVFIKRSMFFTSKTYCIQVMNSSGKIKNFIAILSLKSLKSDRDRCLIVLRKIKNDSKAFLASTD